jgi:TRAP-type C4-dicarboxylate transport system permease large subunit
MDTSLAVLLSIGILAVLLAVRVPVAFSLLISGIAGVILIRDTDHALAAASRLAYSAPSRYILIVIPLFIAMGIFAKHGSLSADSYALASRLLRRLPGGLAIATVATCAGFAAVSGSSVATVATIGPVAVREMRAAGYARHVAAGIVGASGTIGVLIPPSVGLVLYGVVTGESIGAMLIAGVVPGIVTALVYIGSIWLRALRQPTLMGRAVPERSSRPVSANSSSHGTATAQPTISRTGLLNADAVHLTWFKAGYTLARIGVVFGIVMGGVFAGFVTPSEASALGAFLTLGFMFIDTRGTGQGWRPALRDSMQESISLIGMVFALLVGASVFTYFLILARVPVSVAEWSLSLPVGGLLLVAILLLMFVPLGMFLDPISMMLIAVPIAHPVVTGLGYSGIWFGILVVKMVELALITPPFGLNAYVVAGAVEDVSVEEAFRGVLWFAPVDAVIILMLFLFPPLTLWLPSLMA